jgi:patatin-related protein
MNTARAENAVNTDIPGRKLEQSPASRPRPGPTFQPCQEKRFAVVMYGGVSLAIYIYGVAQELFRLVKSTAPGTDASELEYSAQVYRKLAEELGARYVVDILSGTSAGGINAVFLAKALANDEPLDVLERLWVDEGDITHLINDRESAEGVTSSGARSSPRSPRSLLNGARMYEKLLAALGDMGRHRDRAGGALVEELDLFVTATDLQGLQVPIRLADDVAYERRYRHVFRFRRRPRGSPDSRNDFADGNDEILAFAARCTSSFPFAFEPVLLSDHSQKPEKWEAFFERYLMQDGGVRSYAARAFADGGYLDNKPFSYAIETIAERHSDIPVDRKLFYVEPSPEEHEVAGGMLPRPNVLENTLKAFSLAHYETISQDLELIRSRNALLERTERILRGTEDDISRLQPEDQPVTAQDWFQSNLDDMISRQGIAYAGYLRLRVARLTDDLAEIIASQGGFALDSDECLAVRYLVRSWRDQHYAYYEWDPAAADDEGQGKQYFTRFIMDFDLGFHLRRLGFAIGKIDSLLVRDEKAAHILEARGVDSSLLEHPGCRRELLRLRAELSGARETIRHLAASRRHGTGLDLSGAVGGIGVDRRTLLDILGPASDAGRLAVAGAVLKERTAQAVYKSLRVPVVIAVETMKKVKKEVGLGGGRLPSRKKVGDSPVELIRWVIAFYVRMFPHYDLVTYPILHTANLGEEIDPVEVFRVSPRKPDRLAGSRLGHFGGFFDRTWRKHDILWGRLDGARRIIASLLPGPEHQAKRDRYTLQAQEAIIGEVLQSPGSHLDLLAQVLLGRSPGDRHAVTALGTESRSDLERALVEATARKLDAGALRASFERFEVDEDVEPTLFVRSITRSVRVVGKMLRKIGDEAGSAPGVKTGAWLGGVGAVATGLVDFLLPGSWLHLLGRRWISLLMVFGILLLVLNALFNMEVVGPLGGAMVGGSALLTLLSVSLGRVARTRTLGPLVAIPVAAVLILLGVGVAYTPAAIEAAKDWAGGLLGL